MITTIIYGIIIFIATFLGAFVGLGGGVIIKPMLDLIGQDSVAAVNFISGCAVFSMSISATIRHIKAKTKIDFRLILLISIGAVAGGFCGTGLFNQLLKQFDNDTLKGIQGITLGFLLILAVAYINIKNRYSLKIKTPLMTMLAGILLGAIAAFLGIGGGPINVAFLVLFFSLSMKDAAVYSVGIIFFSQLSKLVSLAIGGNIPKVDVITLCVAVACAVLGGILGATANKKGNERFIKTVFTIVVAGIAVVNFYNGINGFIG